MKKRIADYEFVKQNFVYDPESGLFTWSENCKSKWCRGKPAGSVSKAHGYITLWVNGGNYYAHVIAWLYMTGKMPEGDIDHADGDRANNKFSNLREASRSQNMANLKLNSKNSSGYKGVHYVARVNKWVASIGDGGRNCHLGYFKTKEAAASAYNDEAIKRFGEFANLNNIPHVTLK
ncbi:MAG: HNH endonuclease [Pantoea sp.]|uniref:HNH endonuclease n=1 Tax=Pantoea sp. TaxID=69393 RepID=UPI00257B5A5B|nr:HNH endonuclease [Pantoea sp.]MBS6034018.1 HNH endonuclease [Pantoea sp.]